MEGLKARLKELEDKAKEFEAKITDGLLNMQPADPSVTVGKNETENRVLRDWGTKRTIAAPKDHQELGESLGIIDFARGASFPARGSWPWWARARGWSGRSSSSCWTSTRKNAATWKFFRRSW